MKHEMYGENVLVKQKEALKTSDGGIVLPDASATKPLKGTITLLPQGFSEVYRGLRVGDEVLFDRFAGTPVVLDGEEYLVMSEEDILIILKGVK